MSFPSFLNVICLIFFIKGVGTQLKGPEDVKKGMLHDEDPLLVEKATIPVSMLQYYVLGKGTNTFKKLMPIRWKYSCIEVC